MFVSPTVVGNQVIIGSCSGTVYSLDRSHGDVLWQYDTRIDGSAAEFHGEPIVLPESLIIPSDAEPTAHVYSFETSGNLLWKLPFAGGVATDPLLVDGRIIVVTATGSVSAIEARSGKIVWTISPDGTLADVPRTPSPAAANGRVFYASNRGNLFAIDASGGKVLWRRKLGTRVNSSLAVLGNKLYAGGMDGILYQLDPKSGKVLAQIAVGGYAYGTLVSNGPILLTLVKGESAELIAVDTRTMKVRWRRTTPREWTTYRPLVSGSMVIAGNEEKELCRFALDDGTLQWCRPVPDIPRGLGLSSDGVLYVGTLRGKVLAYRLPK